MEMPLFDLTVVRLIRLACAFRSSLEASILSHAGPAVAKSMLVAVAVSCRAVQTFHYTCPIRA